MRAAPAADIVAFYEAESGRSDSAYDFDRAEWAINRIGYAMLREGRIDDAVAVFALNVCEHPSSANAHDSLGNAYLERGDLDAALSSNGRVLEPEPSSQNARAMIERIETARGSGS
jgi:tetratricopeptide (TPR) repeat protein